MNHSSVYWPGSRPRSIVAAIAIAIALLTSLVPNPSAAQEAPSERSPLVAALLQAVLPPIPLGYVYAGSLARGLIPTGVMVGGATLIMIEGVQLIDWTDDEGSETLLYVGLGALLGGYVFGIWDAADAARDRNARVRAGGAALRLLPTANGVGIAVVVPVG